MVDRTEIDQLKASADLLSIISNDVPLTRVSSTNGGEYAGPCPFCGGEDRFRVWPTPLDDMPRFWCRRCNASGDVIAYVMQRDGRDFRTACEWLGLDLGKANGARIGKRYGAWMGEVAAPPLPRPAPMKTWPADTEQWQAAACAFVEESERTLWSDAGAKARDWLHKRGLSDDTIRAAMLGFNTAERYDPWNVWGVEPKPGKTGVWLPRGIVIPWWERGKVRRVNIRRPVGDPKYIGPAGFANTLYNGAALTPKEAAVLVEGEFDALSILQVALDLPVIPVATGSTQASRLIRWLADLALCREVLVAFDADDAGDEASAWWLTRLENARRLRPTRHDVSDMLKDGDDVRAWLLSALPHLKHSSNRPQIEELLLEPIQPDLAGLLAATIPNASAGDIRAALDRLAHFGELATPEDADEVTPANITGAAAWRGAYQRAVAAARLGEPGALDQAALAVTVLSQMGMRP